MKERSKDEALKNWEKKKKPSSPKRDGKSLKRKRGTLYIIVKCITLLLCSNE
ncbi:small polypeptide DEVIL 7-like [Raphanus sativus]|uniref:Small polypeptide DEVIL 7-like n=1 Tax=Raphanus sativus TaxID=3726 RepID=A0A9W3CTC4_RAPSA|nr:small polypeptide DEVIL 7-like [Raphanus sativus]